MNLDDLKAELSIKSIQLERAINAGLPHSELIQIYKEIKELQYRLLMVQVKDRPGISSEVIE